MRPAIAAALILALAAPAAAQEEGAPAATPPEPQAAPPKAPPSDLDFELLPAAPDAAAQAIDPALEREVARRRKMLTLHQGLGIATWTAMAATVVVGQLDFDDRFRGGGDTGKYHGWHEGLAYVTTALFATTASLALLAPEPYPKKARLDTATIHKVSMTVAALGLATQIALGIWARSLEGQLSERDVAAAHQVVGYATLGAMTVGGLVLVF